jgi:hypothetical protein
MIEDFPDSVAFRVSTADLNGAIEILRTLGGLAEHPLAYQALVLERSRQELQSLRWRSGSLARYSRRCRRPSSNC